MDNDIKITTCCSGDWTIIQVGDYKIDGHRIENSDIADLLRHLGFNVEMDTISDENMEALCQ